MYYLANAFPGKHETLPLRVEEWWKIEYSRLVWRKQWDWGTGKGQRLY